MAAPDRGDAYDTTTQGGIGESYNRLIAIRLLSRAAIAGRPFKLAIELKAADKFDDVAFHNERTKEWWLIQAKHSLEPKELTWEAMFPRNPTDGDFVMVKYLKSYLHVRGHPQYGGEKIRLFLFTNRSLHKSIEARDVPVDEMLLSGSSDGGKHVQLLPGPGDLTGLVEFINYKEICDALVKLFLKADGRVVNTIGRHLKLASTVLIKEGPLLKFSANFLRDDDDSPNSELRKLLKSAFGSTDMSTVSVRAPAKFPDLWSGKTDKTELPQTELVDEDTVKAFFGALVLSVSQPNAKQLAELIQLDLVRWMRSWVRPDVLRAMTEDQLQEPFNTIAHYFQQWENPFSSVVKRRFLTTADGSKCLDTVRSKLSLYVKQYGRQGYVGLDAAEEYYVGRRVIFESLRESTETFREEEFIARLLDVGEWAYPQFVALFAEPGMGKSTLWQHLAFYAQREYEDVEVFLIYLNDFKSKLPTITRHSSAADAMELLRTVISDVNIAPLLEEEEEEDRGKKTVLFLDAFDELREENKATMLSLLKLLSKKKSKVKFLISSRERCREELEENIYFAKTIKVLPFNDSDRHEFLRSFWKVQETTTTSFEAFSRKLLQKFNSSIPRQDRDSFVGLPLMMKMLAEVMHESYEKFASFPKGVEPEFVLSKVPLSVIYLYEQFVRKAITITLNKKWKLSEEEAASGSQLEKIFESMELNYQLHAMNQMGFDCVIKDSHKTQLERFHQSVRTGKEESLLLETAGGNARFSHLSYAEYFGAKYLYKEMLTSEPLRDGYLTDICTQQTGVRRFLFKMIDVNISSAQIDERLEVLKATGHLYKFWACEENCAKLLVSATQIDEVGCFYEEQTTLLHVAAKSYSCELMQDLLKAAKNVNVENLARESPLSVACREGRMDMVKILTSAGADVNHRSGEKEAPLNAAIVHGHLEVVEYLIGYAAEVNPSAVSVGHIPLAVAARAGHFSIVRVLVKNAFADIDARNYKRETPLHHAARGGHSSIFNFLLDNGANASLVDASRNTVLHHAAYSGELKLVAGILEFCSSVDAQDKNGDTPLFLAAGRGHLDVVRALIGRGADVGITNSKQETVLHAAIASDTMAVVEELLEQVFNAFDWFDNTSLFAASIRRLDVVRYLMAKGTKSHFALSHAAVISGDVDKLLNEISRVHTGGNWAGLHHQQQ